MHSRSLRPWTGRQIAPVSAFFPGDDVNAVPAAGRGVVIPARVRFETVFVAQPFPVHEIVGSREEHHLDAVDLLGKVHHELPVCFPDGTRSQPVGLFSLVEDRPDLGEVHAVLRRRKRDAVKTHTRAVMQMVGVVHAFMVVHPGIPHAGYFFWSVKHVRILFFLN